MSFSDPRQRRRADFLVVMEAKGEVSPARTLKLSVRSDLLSERPSKAQQSSVNSFGFRRVPDAHAAKSTFSGPGTSSLFSIMSANT